MKLIDIALYPTIKAKLKALYKKKKTPHSWSQKQGADYEQC